MRYAESIRALASRLILGATLGAAFGACASGTQGGAGTGSGGSGAGPGGGAGGAQAVAGSGGSASGGSLGGSAPGGSPGGNPGGNRGGSPGGAAGGASGGGMSASGGSTVLDAGTTDAGNADAVGAGGAGSGVDAGSPGTPSALESIALPAAGTAVAFKTSLAQGGLYLLKASGSVAISGGQTQDAEFASTTGAAEPADMVNGTDVGINVGLLQIHAPMGTKAVAPGPGRMKWFGSYRSDHTYYMTVTGAGQELAPKLVTAGGSASGSMAVSLFLLAAPPPASYTPMPGPMPAPAAPPSIGKSVIETLYIPNSKTTVHSMLTAASTAVYLLQASGAVRAGGGGLKMGDADYDDWQASGAGANNNDGTYDFGIGVDESDIGAGYRMRWWGPFRNDHIYYMLYAGTGSPISFLYFDSAYGDNIATDAFPMSIFPVP